ncbi:MAG: ANTAR domain-containing protein [Lachnospiraceae bacterium]|nr:ANTAR domain-containing protein [Lachnospiraceae bacterium]
MRNSTDSRNSVLIVSDSEKLNTFVQKILSENKNPEAVFKKSASTARREILTRAYDLVIINTPLPDETGIDLALDLSEQGTGIVLLCVSGEVAEEVRSRVSDYGIMVSAKPVSKPVLSKQVRYLFAIRDKIRKVEKKAQSLEEKMEELRTVNRAKWLLITKENLSEEKAHAKIMKTAMDSCISKRLVAEEIIDRYKEY